MTTGTLALIIATLLIAQVAALLLSGYYRRWRQNKQQPQDGETTGKAAGWSGLREFEVKRRVVEDTDGQICSFYLAPLDGEPLPPFKPGQYLTFRLDMEGADGGGTITRCYSLSDRPGSDHYRVTIKRVPAPLNQPELPPGRRRSWKASSPSSSMWAVTA